MLSDKKTIPLSNRRNERPTFRQLRERYHLSYAEIAQQSQVRMCKVYWMEQGCEIELPFALRIMDVLSKYTKYKVRAGDIQGVHIKQDFSVKHTF